jgi:carboxylesterase
MPPEVDGHVSWECAVPVLPGAEPFAFEGGPVGALLVHGFTGSPQSMREWGEYLAKNGLTVRGPRLPGHGTRWQEMNQTRWSDWYGEAERGLRELQKTCGTVFVMGLSMGGTLTLRLAEEHPEIAGIVLVNPSVLTENKAARILPLLKAVIQSLKAISNDIKAPGVTELAYDRTPLRAAASLAELWRLVLADLRKVTQPTLLLRSAEDHIVEPSNARELLARIGATDVEEVVLPDSYHVATLDNDKMTIFERSLEFVRRLAPEEPTAKPRKAGAPKSRARKSSAPS